MSHEKEYVLGTHDAEVERLGLQHRVWLRRATAAWRRGGFTAGQALIDVGCGPGWATLDLAGIVGPTGRIVALERSRRFLDALEAGCRARGVTNVEPHELDLDADPLPVSGADGAWSRWVYAFVTRPRDVLAKVVGALRPGGTLVMHEYVDYRGWRMSPRGPAFEGFVREVMATWRDQGGEADIGLELPRWLHEAGAEVVDMRAIVEVSRPGDHVWQWPAAFLDTGLRRMVDLGRMDAAGAEAVLAEVRAAEAQPGSFMLTPSVLEIVARRR